MPAISAALKSFSPASLPIIHNRFCSPLIRLQLNDLAHEGSSIFLSAIHGNEDIDKQVQTVLNLLYTPSCLRPGTRSVTLIVRSMEGVAYTTGAEIDKDHKEIHVSLEYIRAQNPKSAVDQRHEVLGVICHELVHCFQWAAQGTAPAGLIEGIADWVRLNSGLAAKHWKRKVDGNWDSGYERTGYFLQYLEHRFGHGTVRKINASLAKENYDEDGLWKQCCGGQSVGSLWREYQRDVERDHDFSSPARHMPNSDSD